MPIVRALSDGLAGERITRIDAILNGTTNAVLSQDGRDRLRAWTRRSPTRARAATRRPIRRPISTAAMPPPSSRSCARLPSASASRPATSRRAAPRSVLPDDFRKARQRGGTIRQIAHAEFDRDRSSLVAPGSRRSFVPAASVFARAAGPQNAAIITGAYAGEITLTGQGAGGDATAVAALGDLHRDRARPRGDRAGAGAERARRDSRTDRSQARGGRVSALIGLQCHLCKATFPADATYVCDKCLGPLEPVYDYGAIKLTRDEIDRRPKNLWRYRELLPITGEPQTGFHSGFTPLVRCTRLADRLGVRELYIKDDSVNHPTLSYKDRVVVGGRDARRRARPRRAGLRVDRQSRQQRRGARRAPRARVLRLHPRQPRGRQGARVGDLRSDDSGHRRQLRRCEPAVHAGGRSARVGVRQHQPALVLRRRREDATASRSSSSSAGASRSTSCRRSPAGRCCRESPEASASFGRSASSTASCRASTRRRPRAARRS